MIQIKAVLIRIEGPITYSMPRGSVISELREVLVEYLKSEWDGKGPSPISWTTYRNAKEFIELLPPNYPDPELGVEERNGAISLEWHFGYRRVLAISIGGGTRLAFAGLNGIREIYGVSEFGRNDRNIPQELLDGVSFAAQ